MTFFGDTEPEDGWDRGDTVGEQLENLRRRVRLLFLGRAVPTLGTLEDIAHAVALARTRHLTARETLRADQLDEDVAFMSGRVP